ncbi:hypothetical protein SESBI_47428 [Sesbania bispinosa]|nr:hypothetical protein SESBI_47428 [Sesbania bispinosa]
MDHLCVYYLFLVLFVHVDDHALPIRLHGPSFAPLKLILSIVLPSPSPSPSQSTHLLSSL